MKLKQLQESINQQRTVDNAEDIEPDATYIHTNDGIMSAVWGPFDGEEAQGFLAHSGMDRADGVTADIMMGSDVIQKDILPS